MNLTEKYRLVTNPIGIGGIRLEIREVEKSDRFIHSLMEGDDIPIHDFPFWVKIWEASIVLADHLIHNESDRSRTVLEIGAGMGLTGLFLGAAGHPVTITDYKPDALELLEMNVRENGLGKDVQVKRLDWHEPDIEGQFSLICGSELIYSESNIEPVMRLFDTYLEPGGSVVLAHSAQRECVSLFLDRVTRLFHMETATKTLRMEKKKVRVVVHTLTRNLSTS
jgi:predicted nicotinamide N-methyase